MADEQHNEDSQKTLVAFVVGLLIGGMLVWAFSGPSDKKEATKEMETEKTETVKATDEKNEDGTPKLSVGEGNIVVKDQAASKSIVMDTATYPVAEGWVGVREYTDDKLGYILGVNRFSESQGLIPEKHDIADLHSMLAHHAGDRRADLHRNLIGFQTGDGLVERDRIAGLLPPFAKRGFGDRFAEDGDFDFNLAGDVQIDQIFSTFTAQ